MRRYKNRPLIYVAGPYTNPDPVSNTHRAVKFGLYLYKTYDVGVIIPHVTLLAHAIEPHDDVEFWYEFDLHHVAACDALVRMTGKSSGADREVEYAASIRIPTFNWTDERHLFEKFVVGWGESRLG